KTPKPAANTVLQSILVRGSPQFLYGVNHGRGGEEGRRADVFFAVPEPNGERLGVESERLGDLSGGFDGGMPPDSNTPEAVDLFLQAPALPQLMADGDTDERGRPRRTPPRVAFTPDGKRLSSSGGNEVLRVFERGGRLGRHAGMAGRFDPASD